MDPLKEPELINKFLNILNMSATGLTQYEGFLEGQERDSVSKEESKVILNRMEGEELIRKDQIANYGGQAFIKITAKGRKIVHSGGYALFLAKENERKRKEAESEKRELETYEITQRTYSLTKKNTSWVIVGAIAAIVAAIAAIIALIIQK